MKHLSDVEKWRLLAQQDARQAVSELEQSDPQRASRIAEELGVAYMVEVVSQLESDTAVDLLQNLPEIFRQKVLAELPPAKAESIREILSYPHESAGALMAKEYLSIPLTFTVRQAIDYLQCLPPNQKGKVSYIYVVDENRRLEGVIQVRDLIFHPPEKSCREILKGPVVQVETFMSQRDVATLLQRHRYLGLPVVDQNQRLVGVISADSVVQAVQKEAEEEIAKIVGTGAEEIKTRSVLKIMRLRLPWLFVNIASGLICALILGIFDHDFPTIAALFLFVPVVLGLSESTGVQGATIVVRNLALGRLNLRDMGRLFLREVLVGIWIGVICGAVVGTMGWIWQGSDRLGMALSFSMVLAISLSAAVGILLPLFFRRLKMDPAMASGPLVLAVCDILTLFVYFTLSSAILSV